MPEHVALHIGVGILIYRHAAGSVLSKQKANAFRSRCEKLADVVGYVDHLFASRRFDRYRLHKVRDLKKVFRLVYQKAFLAVLWESRTELLS